ncbi:MAG: hydroxyacylglutathione hydrolase [Gammaproteobacteria bacterium]|nr:hydroxyacylglutathione hydrolase [Gammaproteobacteria bacterium]
MLSILPIPAFRDNYIWLAHDGQDAFVVDPGDAAPVQAHLAELGLRLSAILITHHHPDHVGGISTLLAKWACPVYGPASEDIPGRSHALREGDTLELSAPAARMRILELPGHTLGHIAYVGEGHAFVGDTLFAGGCGRLFEGTPAQMLDSLDKLSELPAATRVYCAHEYTLANLRFALAVEGDNPALAARLQHATRLREQGLPTVPSTIGEEITTNPFLRSRVQSVAAAASRHAQGNLSTPEAVFAEVRRWKDGF